ncbi:MAG TPA: HD domain-containing phosphohydrolase [Candidatus Elarobacter sp.]|jgi:HD-GYP domain-containing protein (c-di-GMP phosphodiesterase class II)|nr:HD domain-containing phosphohydrolase [Candidatus Elarobacter sp.]
MDPLRTLVERLDTNDPATAAHGRAVALWCSRIAVRMRLSREEQNALVRSAQLHDVGKLAIPAELLRAPRLLSEAEREIVRNHVFDGERILREHGLLMYRDAVRHHHERFDGRGYPDGLSGEGIPLSARIVAVADAYDAMTGQRPYRFPMTPDRALLEIERMRGTQFDPAVVDVMLAVVGDALRPVAV